MTPQTIDERFLLDLIKAQSEESLTLEYKAAASLSRAEKAKKELTKDVSAMANSAGGRIIFGIREAAAAAGKRHLPDSLDPCSRSAFSKEWLEQVLAGIQPRLDGLVIAPVPLSSSPDHVAYVVDIEQSTTAHQAGDLRYYRRHNFESVPMQDYEIRDVMNRSKYPAISASVRIEIEPFERQPVFPGLGEVQKGVEYRLSLGVRHDRGPLARFLNGFIAIPRTTVAEQERSSGNNEHRNGREYLTFFFDNTRRDVVGIKGSPPFHTVQEGPSWFDPILPGTSRRLFSVRLDSVSFVSGAFGRVEWSLHADNAPPSYGAKDWHEIEQVRLE